MNDTRNLNFDRIAEAIGFIKSNFKDQPILEEIAKSVHLSPFYFQRLFTDWAGISPKKFMQFLSVEYAKTLLKDQQVTLFDATEKTGLSSTGRLHDLFISIEGMTPGAFKNGGRNLMIKYSFHLSLFGNIIVASTDIGICYLAFYNSSTQATEGLKNRFPNAEFKEEKVSFHSDALAVFQGNWNDIKSIKLHLNGTPFQLKVWNALLQIPLGNLSTYGKIAEIIEKPKASRAVGRAIGSNPIAFIIPCHRVIQSSGKVGRYMWGATRKSAIIGWEAAKVRG